MLPVLISSAFDQVYMIVGKAVASSGIGDITILDYGNRVSTMVSAVLLTSIATVLYPTLVKNVDSSEDFRRTLSLGVNLNLLIAIPAMAALTLLRLPVTRLVFERGAFTAKDSLLTCGTLACYSCGILGVGLREIGNRTFTRSSKPVCDDYRHRRGCTEYRAGNCILSNMGWQPVLLRRQHLAQ